MSPNYGDRSMPMVAILCRWAGNRRSGVHWPYVIDSWYNEWPVGDISIISAEGWPSWIHSKMADV